MSLEKLPSNDWFLSAIAIDGTVGQSLRAVLSEVRRKESFILNLMGRLSEKPGTARDSLSELSARVSCLETTLKLRLSILSPERPGAWFRSSHATSAGPFAASILPDPIFSSYDEADQSQLRKQLIACWNSRNLIDYPMRATESCLWKILLTINFELQQLGDLGDWPRLERLPDELPDDFRSRSLFAFLENVKNEYLSCKDRLNVCFSTLLMACDKYWNNAKFRQSEKQIKEAEFDGLNQADRVRQDFRRRRSESAATIKPPKSKSLQDLEALRCFGFSEFPEIEILKHRYHELALGTHPDREGGNDAKFKLVSKSYKHLLKTLKHI